MFEAFTLSANFEEFTIGIRGKTGHVDLRGRNAFQIKIDPTARPDLTSSGKTTER
jgi:hypothetical protein